MECNRIEVWTILSREMMENDPTFEIRITLLDILDIFCWMVMKKRPDRNRHRFGIGCSCSTRPKRFLLTEARKLVEKRCLPKSCWYCGVFSKRLSRCSTAAPWWVRKPSMNPGKRFSKTGSPTLMSFHHDCGWELKGLLGATGGERSNCQCKSEV